MKHLVLAGGGHAHLSVLKHARRFMAAGHRLTVVGPDPVHYYSGMGPGLLEGRYEPGEIAFNVRRMIETRGGFFVQARAVRIDAGNRRLVLDSGDALVFDVLSCNVGSGIAVPETWGRDIVPVKPIVNLLSVRRRLEDRFTGGDTAVVVVGGGPAGVEVAGAILGLARRRHGRIRVTLVGGRRLLRNFPDKAARLARESLARRGADIREGVRLDTVEGGAVVLSNGDRVDADLVLLCTGVRPPSLFLESGLPTGSDGGLLVDRTLQAVGRPGIFGGGDCVSLEGHALRRVGVYAVRQNPVLLHNLLAALENRPLLSFDPGGAYLLLFNLGDGTAIFHKQGRVYRGRSAMWLKDRIDRRFMRRYQDPAADATAGRALNEGD